MSARIRHLALYTENQQGMASCYKSVFGMKRITESFNQPNHGHISDGVIGLAVLRRRPGFHAALDHFGFEVDDVNSVLDNSRTSIRRCWSLKAWNKSRSRCFAVTTRRGPNSIFHGSSTRRYRKVIEMTVGSRPGKSIILRSDRRSRSGWPSSTMKSLISRKAKICSMKTRSL